MSRKNKKERLAYQRHWYAMRKEQQHAYRRKYRAEHRARIREYQRNHYAKLRKSVFSHYGLACKCCGETTDEFLCIDHINGGGRKHLKSIGERRLYRWLIKNNFPEGFQTLCHNCNMAKGLYGQCPHQKHNP